MVTVLQKKYDSFQELKKEVDELRAKANVTVVLPSRAELPAFFDALQSDSTLAGVQIIKWENQPEVPFTTLAVAAPVPGAPANQGGPAVMASATPGATAPGAASSAALAIKVPVAIVVTGSYQQINRYFYAIYGGNSANPTDKRLISIEALTIKPVLNSSQLPTGQLVAREQRASGLQIDRTRQPDAFKSMIELAEKRLAASLPYAMVDAGVESDLYDGGAIGAIRSNWNAVNSWWQVSQDGIYDDATT